MPFSTWLPMTMVAPVPVSSLVHSSTLVTAGVYLIIRFNRLIISNKLNFYLSFICIFTIIISGINALYESDLKKLLPILNQLGLIMMILGMGFRILGFTI